MSRRSFKLRTLIAALTSITALGESASVYAQNKKEAEQSGTLPTLVISGSKRDQRLDNLTGAAAIANRTELDDAQVRSTADLGRVFPDLQMSYSGSQLFPLITVRGVTSAQDFYNPALTVYVDGVPQLPVSSIQSMLDVERVELLKGPQGTLYGKSAQGGILNIVTYQPDNTVRAIVRAGISSHWGYDLQTNVSTPLIQDLLYGSASFAVNDVPGELHSDVLGNNLGGARNQTARFKLRMAPSGAPWELGLSGGRDCSDSRQDVYLPYNDVSQRNGYALPGLPADFRNPYQRRCVNSLNGTGQYDLGQWRINAIVSTQRLSLDREFPFGPQYSWQPEQWRQNTQELRLSTRPQDQQGSPSRSWDGVFGLYRQEVDQSRRFSADMVMPTRTPFLDSRSRNKTESISAYGDMTWYATSKIDLSAGLRVSHDSASTNFGGNLFGSPIAGDKSIRQDTWLGRIGAGYRFLPQLRGYVNLAQGYKPAGYSLSPTSVADTEGFGRERSTNYELGMRYATTGLRSSFALYRVDTSDSQLYGNSSTLAGYQTLKNVGDTRSTGAELSIDWDVTRSWSLGLAGFITDAKFRRYADGGGCTTCSGNKVPFVPEHGVTITAKGRVRVGETMLRPRMSARYIGTHYFDTANTLKQSGYTLVDAGVAWSPTPSLEAALYVNNLTDQVYRTYGFSRGSAGDFAQVGLGRTVGLTLTYAY